MKKITNGLYKAFDGWYIAKIQNNKWYLISQNELDEGSVYFLKNYMSTGFYTKKALIAKYSKEPFYSYIFE